MHPCHHAAATPDKAAVIVAETGAVLTYGELEDASNRAAQFFRSQGLKRDDRIAFFLSNTPDYFPLVWGAQRSGLRFVAISAVFGAFNGYILTQFKMKGSSLIFAGLLFSMFIPFQIVLIPMARTLGLFGLAGTVPGLILVHVIYGIGFTTLFFRNYYSAFPAELVRSARMDGAGFFRLFWRILLPNSGPILVVAVIWQFTNIWNDFLFGVSFSDYKSFPVTVALNNLVNSSTGVKEYNVHFAAAFIAAAPTLLVYILSGKYFVRGLMAGSVKG